MCPELLRSITWILSLSSIQSVFVFYDRSKTSVENFYDVHCLRYSYRMDWNPVYDLEYCIRIRLEEYELLEMAKPNYFSEKYTFDELFLMKKTAEEVLQWSTSIEVAEKYLDYIDTQGRDLTQSNFTIFKCERPWFGPECQYSFDTGNSSALETIIFRLVIYERGYWFDDHNVHTPCLINIKCNMNDPSFCLHWYEICDGNIDCIDTFEDEKPCFILEINECQEDEYRCYNGLCIPYTMAHDEHVECLDRSDVSTNLVNTRSIWEEFAIKSIRFAKHERKLHFSESTRSVMLLKKKLLHLTKRRTLDYYCWQLLICLTRMRNATDEISCESIIKAANIENQLSECDSLVLFPEIPVFSNHVYFLYQIQNLTTWYSQGILFPSYICFDRALCEQIKVTFIHENKTCFHAGALTSFMVSDDPIEIWYDVIEEINNIFYACDIGIVRNHLQLHSNTYCCINASKCVSKHRIMDGVVDCPFQDDEEAYDLSCTIKERLRYRCSAENYCRSPFLSLNTCFNARYGFDTLRFSLICDRIIHSEILNVNGKNHTDETDCENWHCNNYYTRCDGYWNCPNGDDERNCSDDDSICPSGSLECFSNYNSTMICLPGNRVSDEIVDCYGGVDEGEICRSKLISRHFPGYLCLNEMKCILSNDICDKKSDCKSNEDEAFCSTNSDIPCLRTSDKGSAVEKYMCRIALGTYNKFSEESMPELMAGKHRKQLLITNTPVNPHDLQESGQAFRLEQIRRCYFGLSARMRIGHRKYRFVCFCPLSHYGDQCQYENERLSVTLETRTMERIGVHAYLISLIDENDNQKLVLSQHQVSFTLAQSCGRRFKFNLIYPNRPKDQSKNYSIVVDAFNRQSMQHLGGWYYSVPFKFLPVYPLAISILVPVYPIKGIEICVPNCIHGSCMKYLNAKKLYCHCDRGWSGIRCDVPIDCSPCADGSVCMGHDGISPICVCPINRIGNRCRVNRTCAENYCENDGECVVVASEADSLDFECMCKPQHSGSVCHIEKHFIEINFNQLPIASYIFAYLFSPNNEDDMNKPLEVNILVAKLKRNSKTVTFHRSISLNMLVIQSEQSYYLAAYSGESIETNLSVLLSSAMKCPFVEELFSYGLRQLPRIQQVKYYHQLCFNYSHLRCFLDKIFICLCTKTRQADCLFFDRALRCNNDFHCLNQAQCFQDHKSCSSSTICICTDCFFGDRCQFYAKGIGLTMDDILRYEIRPNVLFVDQSGIVIIAGVFGVIMLSVGLINSLFSLMTFYQKKTREVGVGLYLMASSISSLITVCLLMAKVLFVIVTHMEPSTSLSILRLGCKSIEYSLKTCLSIDNWLNASVAIERLINIRAGTNFNKQLSKKIALGVIPMILILVCISFIHEIIYRTIFFDQEENQFVCSMTYSTSIHIYSTSVLFFHILGPFLANLVSASFIIIKGTRQRANLKKQTSYTNHLIQQITKHKHLVISPMILAALSIPRLIIALLSDCVQNNRDPSMYLIGYFISFIPSVTVFLIFVLPSKLFRDHYRKTLNQMKRWVMIRFETVRN